LWLMGTDGANELIRIEGTAKLRVGLAHLPLFVVVAVYVRPATCVVGPGVRDPRLAQFSTSDRFQMGPDASFTSG
jgi:hypothetical protein